MSYTIHTCSPVAHSELLGSTSSRSDADALALIEYDRLTIGERYRNGYIESIDIAHDGQTVSRLRFPVVYAHHADAYQLFQEEQPHPSDPDAFSHWIDQKRIEII